MAKPSGDFIPPGGFVLLRTPMTANRDDPPVTDLSSPQPAWAEAWHLWTVIFPRRSITGRIVYGKVWRRFDGRHWMYKKFTEFNIDRDH
jgi:hypothetical protein